MNEFVNSLIHEFKPLLDRPKVHLFSQLFLQQNFILLASGSRLHSCFGCVVGPLSSDVSLPLAT